MSLFRCNILYYTMLHTIKYKYIDPHIPLFCTKQNTRAEPGIACIFGSPLTEDSHTVKYQKRVESGNQKYGESRKHGSSAFRYHSIVSTFFLLPRLGSACKIRIHLGISLTDPGDAALCCRRRC